MDSAHCHLCSKKSLVGAVGSSIPVRHRHVPPGTVSLGTTGWQALALYDASPNLQGESKLSLSAFRSPQVSPGDSWEA